MSYITIAIDAMGGDYGPSVIIPAVASMVRQREDLKVILVGDQETIHEHLHHNRLQPNERIHIQHTTEVVGMDEPPAQALRFKKDSSMRVAINLVKQGEAQACVSAGNTGALMATARFVLKTLPGIDRPAISALLPTMNQSRNVRVLDLGANVDSTAEHLFQFAVMGSVLASAVGQIRNPAVGLLNIGEEDIKGNEQVQETAKLLSECDHINYIGFIEGDDIYKGTADVVICDGFVGNVALKTSEGLAKLLTSYIKDAFTHNVWSKLMALLAMPILRRIAKRLDPARYNGASLIGLRGTVIKSHGSATSLAFANAINEAIIEVQKNIPERIGAELGEVLEQTVEEPSA